MVFEISKQTLPSCQLAAFIVLWLCIAYSRDCFGNRQRTVPHFASTAPKLFPIHTRRLEGTSEHTHIYIYTYYTYTYRYLMISLYILYQHISAMFDNRETSTKLSRPSQSTHAKNSCAQVLTKSGSRRCSTCHSPDSNADSNHFFWF